MSANLASRERPPGQSPSHEAALLDYAERLAQHRDGRRAAHVRLSHLGAANRREHHLRIAINTLEPLLRKFEGKLFRMWNEDLVVTTKDASIADIDDYVLKLRFLFSQDPLIKQDAAGIDQFCVFFDMRADHAGFLRLAQEMQTQAERERVRTSGRRESMALQAQARGIEVTENITPALLDRFEAAIRTADLIPMIQHQMICALPEKSKPLPVMSEFFVSIQALQKKFLPGVNCASDRWLFQHLSKYLDYRMLTALPSLTQGFATPITINLNVSTLLSVEFLKFDAAMRNNRKHSIICELQCTDILSDMAGYIFARNFLRERKYGVALDGLDHLTFPMIDGNKLGVDFYKIQWHPSFTDDVMAEHRAEFAAAIRVAGASRVILCRCDDQSAIDFGREVGIALFQGRHLDRMLSAG